MSNFERWYTQDSVIKITEEDKDAFIDKDNVTVYRGDLPSGAKTDDETGLQDIFSLNEEAGPDFQGSHYHFNIKFPLEKFFSTGAEKVPDFSTNNDGLLKISDLDRSLKNPSLFSEFKDFCKQEFIDYIRNKNKNIGDYLDPNSVSKIITPLSDDWFFDDGEDLLNCIFGDPKEPAIDEEGSPQGAFSTFFMTNNFYAPPNPKKTNIIHVQGILMVGLDETDALDFLLESFPEGASITKQFRKEPSSTGVISKVYDKASSIEQKNKPKVYNDGTVVLKTIDEINSQRNPSAEIRQLVHNKVKTKLDGFSDSAFLNMINSSKRIETMEDVYDNVLNVMPLDDIMKLAVECCKKYIPEADMISRTTDVVLKNLSNQEVNKILNYASTNNDFFSTKFKEEIVSKFESETGEVLGASSPQMFKSYLISKSQESDALKDITSSVLFSSVPSAIMMLATLDFEKAEEMLSSIVESGIESGLEQIQSGKLLDLAVSKISQATGLPADQAVSILNLIRNSNAKIQQSYKQITGMEASGDFIEQLIRDLLCGDLSRELILQKLQQTQNITGEQANAMLSQVPEIDSAESLSSKTGVPITQIQQIICQGGLVFSDSFQGLLSSDNITTLGLGALNEAGIGDVISPGFTNEIVSKVEDIIAKGRQIAETSEDLLKENFKNFDDFTGDVLKNPMEKILGSIGDQLDSYQNLTYTGDLYDSFKNVLLNLINEIVVQAVNLIIKEIASMCEGTAASDLANSKGATDEIFNPNSLEELTTTDSLKDDVFDVVSAFPTYDTVTSPTTLETTTGDLETTTGDLETTQPITENEIRKDLSDLVDDISVVLTTSELCSLFSDPVPGSIPYDMAFDKIWYGLLSLEKYQKLKKVVNGKDKVKRMLDEISENFDQVACNQRVENLIKTKKLFSELCAPNSNDDFANSLKSGLTKEAITLVLEQENSIIDDVLNSMNKINMADVGLMNRPLFCGPEARETGKEPYFNTTQHRSLNHLNKKELKSIFTATQTNFEAEISKFQTIMTDPIFNISANKDNLASSFAGAFNAAAQARGVMQEIYKKGGEFSVGATPDTTELERLVAQYGVIAKRVQDQLNDIQADNIDVQVFDDVSVVKISITPSGDLTDDFLYVFMNFGNQAYSSADTYNAAVLPKTSKIFFRSSDTGTGATYEADLAGTMPFGPSGVFAQNSANFFGNDDYSTTVKNLVQSGRFFGVVIEQIIKEHAEYITTQDLFKKQNFNRLKLKKDTVCDENCLFYYRDMLNSYSDLVEKIECVVGFNSVPSPMEMAKIYYIFEGYIRILTVNEMMKSFFVFASFGMSALMPESDETDSNNSFYFNYLTQQIRKKIAADKLLTDNGSLQDILKIVYYAKNILSFTGDKNIETPDKLDITKVLTFFSSEAARRIQSVVRTKLDQAGFNTKNLKDGGTFGVFQEEFSLFKTVEGLPTATNTVQNEQKLSNILAHDIERIQYLNPPPVVDVRFGEKCVVIPSGYYSQYEGLNGRLANGGFFIEKGLEVEHAYESDTPPVMYMSTVLGNAANTFTLETYQELYENLNLEDGEDRKVWQRTFKDHVFGDTDIAKYLFGGLKIQRTFNNQPFGAPESIPAFRINENFTTRKEVPYNPELNVPELTISLDSVFRDTSSPNPFLVEFFNKEGAVSIDSDEYQGYMNVLEGTAATDDTDAAPSLYQTEFVGNAITGIDEYYRPYGAKELTGEAANEYVRDILRPARRYFRKFQYYTSLNILIPVDEIEESFAPFLEILNLDITSDDQSKKAFIKAALDKKYFVREANGRKYFKLPIVKITNANPTLPATVDNLFDEIKVVTSIFEGNTALAQTQVRNEFANSTEFKNLMNSIDYKSLLSFISILITEVVGEQYPDIDKMFNKAKQPLKAGIKHSLRRGNRFNDKTSDALYKPDLPTVASFTAPGSAVDLSIVYQLLSVIIKATANFMDPLWRTPWYLPGPATPIGITAKILEAIEDLQEASDEGGIDFAATGQKAYNAANPASDENNEKLKRAMGITEDQESAVKKCEDYLAGSESVSDSNLVSPLES